MRKFKDNNYGSVVPVVLFIVTIVGCGALYTLFFIEIAIPEFGPLVPNSDSKVYIMMVFYAIPLFIILVGAAALLIKGLKRDIYYPGGG